MNLRLYMAAVAGRHNLKSTLFSILCIASLVSVNSARAEYSPDQSERMAAARKALEQKLYELDHSQTATPDTKRVAVAAQPVKPVINPPATAAINIAAAQPARTPTAPTEAVLTGSDDGARTSRRWTQKLYANIDFGGVYQQENTTLFQSAPFPTSSTASFNLGLRGNVALGYNINRLWAVEFDSGVLWNSMDKVNGVSIDQPYPFNVNFDTYTVPMLANLVFKIPIRGPLVPYIGAGVGGTATILSYSQASSSMEDCDFEFAYQAEAGLKYKFGKKASVGIVYQFLGTSDPTWHSVLSVAGQPPLEYRFTEKGFYTHSLVISFAWNF